MKLCEFLLNRALGETSCGHILPTSDQEFDMKRSGFIAMFAVGGLLSALVGQAAAAPKFKIPFPFKRVEADPRKSYKLTEDHGPWLILAASFFSETGKRQARELALELRKTYKVKAYTYQRHFDFAKPVKGLGVDRYGNPRRMKHRHNAQFEETAVLVGDFASFDDNRAQKILEKIKHAKPKTLSATPDNPTSQRMRVWREIQRRVHPSDAVRRKGPMGSAFITRNPLLPEEYFADKGPDKVIFKLNTGLEHSLLDCPKQYTVRVATFRGQSTWDLNEIEKSERRFRRKLSEKESQLAQGAKQARLLVAALRRRGVEAYQFHDRHESMVTVGSFDSVGDKRADGRIEIDPLVHEVMNRYGSTLR